MALPSSVDDPLAERMARYLRALAQPIRIQLLAQLRSGPQTVHELCDATATTQQNVSKHLGLLHDAGLVHRQQVGAQVVYSQGDGIGSAILEHAGEAVARQAQQLESIAQALQTRAVADA